MYREYEEFDNPAHESREREVRERATPLWEALKVECRRIKVRQDCGTMSKLRLCSQRCVLSSFRDSLAQREAPARSNKKLGTRSQKDLRADAHHRFSQDVSRKVLPGAVVTTG